MLGPGFEGSAVGWVVLFVLLAAFTYAMVALILAALGRVVKVGPDWTAYVIPILCVVGLGVSGYLTVVEARQASAICGPIGDCNTVQSSPYAMLFGFLPVGVLGGIGYLAILAAWAIAQFVRGRLSHLAAVSVFALSLFGVLFSIYLTYLELVIIRAVCIWCLTSALIMAALLMLTTGSAVARAVPAEEVDA